MLKEVDYQCRKKKYYGGNLDKGTIKEISSYLESESIKSDPNIALHRETQSLNSTASLSSKSKIETVTGYSSTNGSCSVKAKSYLSTGLITPFVLSSSASSWSEGTYMGSGIAKSLTLRQNYKFSGTTIAISWPPSVTASSSSGTWTSSAMANCNYAKACKDNVSGTSLISTCKLTVADYSDFLIGTTAHKSSASASISPWEFI